MFYYRLMLSVSVLRLETSLGITSLIIVLRLFAYSV